MGCPHPALKKVSWWWSLGRGRSVVLGCLVESTVLLIQSIVQLQNTGDITTPVAVVGGRPDSDNLLVEHELESFEDKLVRSSNQVQPIRVGKGVDYVSPEEPACSTRRHAPSIDVCLRQKPMRTSCGCQNSVLPGGGPDRPVKRNSSSPSGSDHSRSHMPPSCGTSCFRSMARIWQQRGA